MFAKLNSYQAYFHLTPLEDVEVVHQTASRYVELKGSGVIQILSKTDAGDVEGSEIPAQRRALVHLGSITPVRSNPFVEVNPLLYLKADVQYRRVYDERGEQQLQLFLSTKSKIDLNELEYIVRIYALA